ncbi:Protein G12 [Melipona quadrifasciata]|uniref:Protein G12 n=1 Tax=Melipona quadrifasciata TaxID=166423 RepID=A0A0N0BIK3_9HYME|nr:Protein G12 [Melipona quadrifasciata]
MTNLIDDANTNHTMCLDTVIYLLTNVLLVYIKSQEKFHVVVLQPAIEVITMKFAVVLFAAFVAFATVNSHTLPDFGKGPLHEDIQYFLDLIPMDQVMGVVLEYAAEDAEFQNLINYCKTSDFKLMIKEIEAIPEFHEFADYLQKNVLGIEFPSFNKLKVETFASSELTKDLQDFLNLVDKKKIMNIVLSYLEDDEVQRALAVMHSEDFHALVRKVEAMREYQDLVRYLEDAGLDMTSLINKIHKLFGMEDYVPPYSIETFANLGGLKGLVNDVIAALPVDKLEALYEEKLRTSAAFKNLIDKLHSQDFQNIVSTVYKTPVFLEMRRKVIKDGVDLTPFRDFVEKFLGIPLPRVDSRAIIFASSELTKDLQDFLNLVDKKKIMNIVLSYLEDDEVQRALAVMHSEDFHALVRKVEAMREYQDLVRYLEDAGLDMTSLINKIHKLFGMEDYVPPYSIETFANLGGLKGLVNDVIAALPVDKLEALYKEKLRTSAAFKNLIDKLHSQDFQNIVSTVFEAMREYQDLVRYLEDAGLDMTSLINKIHKLFGMEDYVPPYSIETFANLGGLKGLVNDVIAALPVDKLEALYKEKLRTSAAFKNLIDKLHSQDFQNIVSTVYKTPVFLEMRRKVIKDGVDLTPFRDFVEKFLGIPLPRVDSRAIIFASSELTKDLQDFLNLVDKKKIMNIVLSYLEDDEVQRALAVMHSEDFHALVRKVEAMREYQDLVRYLEDAGLDMTSLINKIHKLFGMEDYVPPYSIETFANLGGLKGLVNDVIAALPAAVQTVKA